MPCLSSASTACADALKLLSCPRSAASSCSAAWVDAFALSIWSLTPSAVCSLSRSSLMSSSTSASLRTSDCCRHWRSVLITVFASSFMAFMSNPLSALGRKWRHRSTSSTKDGSSKFWRLMRSTLPAAKEERSREDANGSPPKPMSPPKPGSSASAGITEPRVELTMPEEFMFMPMPMLFMPMPMFMFMLTEGAVTGRATGMDVCAGLFSAIGAMDILARGGRLAAVAPGAGAPSRSAPVVSCSKGMARDCRIMLSRLTTLRRARNELRSATPETRREGSEAVIDASPTDGS